MRNISWCPCLNTRLNLNIGINYVERAVVYVLTPVYGMVVYLKIINCESDCRHF